MAPTDATWARGSRKDVRPVPLRASRHRPADPTYFLGQSSLGRSVGACRDAEREDTRRLSPTRVLRRMTNRWLLRAVVCWARQSTVAGLVSAVTLVMGGQAFFG